MLMAQKPHLSLSKILQMNIGFLGLQYSFGLQQANMAPIFSYLHASEGQLPILQLAGPLTGLLIQPIIGAMSDRTSSRWGRRTPYFVIGAIMCSLGLLIMPFSSSILMAVSLMWLLDAGNNTTMEPYRAYVKDRLNDDQHEIGFLMQSAFTGLAQTLAYLLPTILVVWIGINKDAVDSHHIPYTTHIAFMIGAILSLVTILWSVIRVPELPLTESERAHIATLPRTPVATLTEIAHAIYAMPQAMRRLGLMCLFQWFAMSSYWTYVTYSISLSVFGTRNPDSAGFHSAAITNGQVGAFFNLIAFVSALAMVPVSRRYGAGKVHAICLTLSGLGMLFMPHIHDARLLFLPAIGIGFGWGSIMGNPYVMLADSIPAERTGVYMGIFNMFIVIPMLLNAALFYFVYDDKPSSFSGLRFHGLNWLGGDARNVLTLAGVLMICAAIAVLFVKTEAKDVA